MVLFLILKRSLRVYILKQLFFSISVSIGFRNMYLDFKEYCFLKFILLLGNLKQQKIIQRLIKILYLTPGSKLVVPRSI